MTEPDEFCEHGNFKRLCFACDGETWADYLRATGKEAPALATFGFDTAKAGGDSSVTHWTLVTEEKGNIADGITSEDIENIKIRLARAVHKSYTEILDEAFKRKLRGDPAGRAKVIFDA